MSGLIEDLRKELSELEKRPGYFTAEFRKGYSSCISDAQICLKENNGYNESALLVEENKESVGL